MGSKVPGSPGVAPGDIGPRRSPSALSCVLAISAAMAGCEFERPSDQGPGPVIGIEADLRIGVVEGLEELQLGFVSALAVDSTGAVYVGDRLNYEVRKFGRNGEYLLRFGQRGAGPGDIGSIRGLAILDGHRVAVVDNTNRRISLFDGATGRYLDSWPAYPQLVWGDRIIRRRWEGGAYVGIQAEIPADGSPVAWPRPVYEARDGHGAILDTIWAARRYVDECGTPSSRGVRSGFWEDYRVRYAPKVVWTITQAGSLVIGCPHVMQFDITRLDGESIQSQEVPYQAVRIAPDEINWFREQMAIGIEETRRLTSRMNADVPIAHADEQSLQFDYPATKAAFKSIVVSDDGRLWVRLSPRILRWNIGAHRLGP